MNKLDPSLLAGLPPFRRLERDQIREILAQATSRRFDEGVAVFHEGAEADRFYLLLDGTIRVVRLSPAGEQVIVLHLHGGQLFGIAAALGRTTYPATAMTAAECVILFWPTALWESFAATYDGFATETYRMVGERMGEMNSRIVELATLNVEQRVANALLRMIRQSGRKVEAGVLIDFPLTRQNISEMTGTTLHTVSRLLSAWQRDGIVESARRRITVTDPHRLMVIATASD